MSDRMTSVELPELGGQYGWAEWGRKPVLEMITMLREKASRDKAAAEAILAASDEDFHVETYVGVHVQRNRTVLQPGKPRDRRSTDAV
jgi:hypothetical protein